MFSRAVDSIQKTFIEALSQTRLSTGGGGQNKAAEVECKVDCLVDFCKQKYNEKFYI